MPTCLHHVSPAAMGKRVLRSSVCSWVTDVLQLITGNCLFHNGYVSERSETLNSVADDPFIEMSAQDAARLGLRTGIRCSAVRPGELTAKLKVNRRFPDGLAFVPENYRACGSTV